ncbi:MULTISPECIES: glycoside hydrolase family 57 protein [unclassified Thioalkalivibrio]|uniref:glycoside hydrolase family 57 protein n=1 Tax=unclassified Thioalkalivibrio TaxID=2621013 RepID=UPI00037C5882|nr:MULTISPECIES: glycoside hydrolase family 57 protein [unclassified Thioalkalivibrio]
MHQPQYFESGAGEYALPWTYLHALKDYTDMAAHLEACPKARAVVNFAPILLEQLADYGERLDVCVREHRPVGDPVLDLLHMDVVPTDLAQRQEILRVCLRAHAPRMIEPFPLFQRLADIARNALDEPLLLGHLDARFFQDLATCYHLAWLGETIRWAYPEVRGWLKTDTNFEPGMRRRLLTLIRDEVKGILPRYRELADSGRVELSFTPYAHPIMPLMIDLASAREAMPEIELPKAPAYPDGEARVRWHIERGLEIFEKHFGFRPHGCWPSEGSLSEATVRLLDEYKLCWTASGQTVLANSLAAAGETAESNTGSAEEEGWLHRPYQLQGSKIELFFRDDGLSDAIGFRYADWHADDAVGDFIHHLENIAAVSPQGGVVSVILDGENAWEYYPENGYHFLNALYERLGKHTGLNLCTFFDVCRRSGKSRDRGELSGLVAGSWVYGTFSTWIGDPDKNRGWDSLIEAREAVDRAVAEDPSLDTPALREQLAICEGSDWCWWFGAYNPAGSVSDFEQLYRRHLARLYQLANLNVPESLGEVLSVGGGDPAAGGTMRMGQTG